MLLEVTEGNGESSSLDFFTISHSGCGSQVNIKQNYRRSSDQWLFHNAPLLL